MRKHISFFAADADQWEADGMSIPDEDSLVLAVWRWFRGREDKSNLSVTAKVLYSMLVKRLESTDEKSETLSSYGKKGAENRWKKHRVANGVANGQAIEKVMANAEWPTATANTTANTTASSTSSASLKNVRRGDTPQPPARSFIQFLHLI